MFDRPTHLKYLQLHLGQMKKRHPGFFSDGTAHSQGMFTVAPGNQTLVIGAGRTRQNFCLLCKKNCQRVL